MRDGWREVPLTEVAEIVMGQSPPGHTYNEDGRGMPFIQGSAEFGQMFPQPVKWCTEPKKVAHAGDCLMSVRAPVGDLNIAEGEICVGRGLAVIRALEGVHQPFIPHLIKSSTNRLRARAGGGMFESITKSGLSSLMVAIPPIEDQRRIVDLIRHADEAIAHGCKTLSALEEAWGALLAEHFGDGVSQERGWEKRRLGGLGRWFGGGTPSKSEPRFWEGGTVPWVTPKDMNGIRLAGAQDRITEEAASRSPVRLVDSGSVAIVVRSGVLEHTLPIAEVPFRAAFNQDMKVILPKKGVSAAWLARALEQRSRAILLSCRRPGTTVASIGADQLKKYEIPVPPLDVQHERLESVLALEGCIELQSSENEALSRARASLLSVLLSGEHEIPESYDRFLTEAA